MKTLCVVAFLCFQLTLLANYPVDSWRAKTENAEYVHRALKKVTDILVYDIYSPPVASRTYAYVCIAGYEAAVPAHDSYRSFAGQLNGLIALPSPKSKKLYSPTIAAVKAILTVGRTMVISEHQVDTFYVQFLRDIKSSGIPNELLHNSLQYGDSVAKAVLSWSAADNYKETRSFIRHAVITDDAAWKPTPPAYMKAVEPHWNKIRPFLLDSATQFLPPAPPEFSTDPGSRFYREALAVRDVGARLTDEQKHIADFWDCNPFRMNVNGHVMYASKKISPGGHWMNIAGLACRKTSAGSMASLEVYACLAVTIADAFISCWDEKYRSNVIRPETYINQYIDPSWMPLLQTPPFPEYTSGHSVLSSAASIILTKMFGDNFSFADSTEVEFGIPVRQFTSFRQAAEEAAISRFYGGIHYMPAIEHGFTEGEALGRYFANRLRMKK